MKVIELTKGKQTIVDDDDFAKFGHLKWHYSHGRAVRRAGLWARERHGIKGSVWLHREIMGNPEGVLVDHINSNPLDNRKCNLRLCTQAQNLANARKTLRHTTSKHKGVHYMKNPAFKNPWQAYISIGGKRKHLGMFRTEEEAALVYNQSAEKNFGEFAKLNEVVVS